MGGGAAMVPDFSSSFKFNKSTMCWWCGTVVRAVGWLVVFVPLVQRDMGTFASWRTPVLHVVNSTMDFYYAQLYCNNKFGGRLVSAHTTDDAKYLAEVAAEEIGDDECFWIGATDVITPGFYETSDCTLPALYRKKKYINTYSAIAENYNYSCVVICTHDGSLHAYDCDGRFSFICEAGHIVKPQCHTVERGGWLIYDGIKYKFFGKYKSWYDAERKCRQENARLMYFNNDDRKGARRFVTNYAKRKIANLLEDKRSMLDGKERIWIGIQVTGVWHRNQSELGPYWTSFCNNAPPNYRFVTRTNYKGEEYTYCVKFEEYFLFYQFERVGGYRFRERHDDPLSYFGDLQKQEHKRCAFMQFTFADYRDNRFLQTVECNATDNNARVVCRKG